MFDFDALDQFEQGLQKAEAQSTNKTGRDDAVTLARADYLLDLSYSLHKRSRKARIDGLHG